MIRADHKSFITYFLKAEAGCTQTVLRPESRLGPDAAFSDFQLRGTNISGTKQTQAFYIPKTSAILDND